jgi:hypothetical protein
VLLETGCGSEGDPMRSEATPTLDLSREVRFAVVMYGRVSLAIYINGVTQELFHMVRATAAKPEDDGTPLVPNGELSETEKVYRRVAQIIDGKDDGTRNPWGKSTAPRSGSTMGARTNTTWILTGPSTPMSTASRSK